MRSQLPKSLFDWNEAPRVRALNDEAVSPGRYVLCWLQQALRACDNPVIDAAILLGNSLGLPVLVYHGVREDYPYASARLHAFILGASRDLERDCATRGLACVQFVDRAAKRERGLVYRLAEDAAAVVLEDQPAFVAQWQSERFAARTSVGVIAVNAACVVPLAALEQGVGTTSAFRRRHEQVRANWYAWQDIKPDVLAYDGPLPFEPDALGGMDDDALAALVAECEIDHKLTVSPIFPPTRAEVGLRLHRLQNEVLPAYAGARGNPSRREGANWALKASNFYRSHQDSTTANSATIRQLVGPFVSSSSMADHASRHQLLTRWVTGPRIGQFMRGSKSGIGCALV